MLRTRQLVDILEGYLGDGVIMTMVLYENGNVLGCAANEKCKESDLEKVLDIHFIFITKTDILHLFRLLVRLYQISGIHIRLL